VNSCDCAGTPRQTDHFELVSKMLRIFRRTERGRGPLYQTSSNVPGRFGRARPGKTSYLTGPAGCSAAAPAKDVANSDISLQV
jgi:hypothetical protein